MEQSIVKCNFTEMWAVKMRKIFHCLDKENKGKPLLKHFSFSLMEGRCINDLAA